MNFLNFRDFCVIFLNLFGLILNLKYLKRFFILCANVLADVVGDYRSLHVCACVYAYVRVYAPVCTCVISGLSIHQGFLLTHYKKSSKISVRLRLFL